MSANTSDPEYLAQSRATELNVFYSIPIPLVVLTTALRLYVRTATTPKASLATDDYLMICATVAAVAVSAVGLGFGPPYGFGRHREVLSPAEFETFMMGNYIFSHCYDMAIATTKLSVLALYYHIFIVPWFRRLVVLTAVFVLLWLLAMEVVLLVGWHPIQSWWSEPGSGLVQMLAFAYFTNITNMIADLWIFVMPIPVLLNLQTGLNKRIGLCFLFSFGLGTCAISAVRLKWIFSMDSKDTTWEEEACMGVLCGNLPVVYKALKDAFIKLLTVHRGQSQEQISLRHRESSQSSPPESHEERHHMGEWFRLRGGVTDMEIV
ncbi:hypothetical protein PG996_015179 [Apiospora saccharicola]|uniref:Rhodopsin domain-containing protein n=1 Tax=Apiospora saccharicola TaxID=335842 RepID=A0ABR1TKE2_9PEZI